LHEADHRTGPRLQVSDMAEQTTPYGGKAESLSGIKMQSYNPTHPIPEIGAVFESGFHDICGS
jgi:hypothetical protein